MAVTHFEITKLPDAKYISSKIGADALVLNQLYPISRQSEIYFERIPALLGFAVKDSFTYKAYDEVNAFYGNEAISDIQWKSNIAPASAISKIFWSQAKTDNLLEVLPLSGGVEFIEIHFNTGAHFSNNKRGHIHAGERLTVFELLDSIAIVDETLDPLVMVEYKVGSGSTVTDTIYSLTIDLSQP